MKTIGLLGGMSWESTVGYYRAINQGIKEALGGLHSAQIVLYSVDFAPLEEWLRQGQWERVAKRLIKAGESVQAAGADFLLLCTNTMHKVAPHLEQALQIPLVHIADATADKLHQDGVRRVGLLGTSITMEDDFYRGRLEHSHRIEVLVPGPEERQLVHQVIFQELCLGKVLEASKAGYLEIVARLAEQGAEGVILGCTEIGMLIQQEDTGIRLYDTTALHAQAAVTRALSGGTESVNAE